jgi:transcription initiation factor IIE alpha subunit
MPFCGSPNRFVNGAALPNPERFSLMLEAIESHAQHLATARMFHRPHSIIRFASNGSFELAYTYFFHCPLCGSVL